ncbi:DUF2808 domain-containing protein [Gloeocapsa sp. PCC 73106]|uniref:DUF2808 domain-containing protein n=1 Tax=Gloeocapsa sp. PCC 73106 TaxID=102232 RepID=UPI0002ACFF7F|nr:DUF2808 domain-containing protein [Gloeocapsa sp. PCC 73106]ELR96914.1 Protein of unknown function (DUF2808) [Gloeocapsa sp. PCC 73106]
MKRKIIVFGCVSLLSTYLLNAEFIGAQTANVFTGKPPSLVRASIPHNSTNWRLPWYYFTLNLPADSRESLSQVTISPGRNFEEIVFRLEDTIAFQGELNNRGKAISIQQVTQDKTNQSITIIFESPIAPDTLFTVALRARSNPRTAGTYLFRIHAFPTGNNPIGMDLGVARFTFYSSFW